MATDILLIREGYKLGAADPMGAEAIGSMANGEQVIATLRRARNPKHHRKLFLMLSEIVKNCDDYLDAEDLLDDIKIRIGFCRKLRRPNGTYLMRPRSISFANMAQDKFEKFYNKAVEIILTEILPGINKDDLEHRIIELLGDKA